MWIFGTAEPPEIHYDTWTNMTTFKKIAVGRKVYDLSCTDVLSLHAAMPR